MQKIVYVVGKIIRNDNWEIIGIFEDENQAVENCLDSDYFVGPIEMNKTYHHICLWPDIYFPKGDPQ